MNKIKRVLALTLVVVLFSLYGITLFAAITASPSKNSLFFASLFCTFAIPFLIFAYTLIYRIIKRRAEEDKKRFKEEQ